MGHPAPDLLELWLGTVGRLVPPERRGEWRAEWRAEMDALRRDGAGRGARLHAGFGALPDAAWHLVDDWSFDTLWNDLTHALRALRRRVSLTALSVLVLGLGLGAALVVVSVVDAVLLRPLPFDEPERLVAVWEQNPTRGWFENVAAPANFFDWRAEATSFEDMALYTDWTESGRILEIGTAPPRPVDVVTVGPRFFDVLGVSMYLGEEFDEDDLWRRTETPRVVLSYELWRRAFAADPRVLGEQVTVQGRDVRVAGVAPAGFAFPRAADLWAPLSWDESAREEAWFRRAHFVRVVGRLAPEAAVDDARAELATIAARLETQYPETNRDMGTGVTPLHEWVVGDTRRPLALVAGAVALLLLVACANVASLMLLRAGARRREMAVRSALGAARRRLVRLLALEGLLLAVAASAVGALCARSALAALPHLAPDVPRLADAAVDPRVLSAGLALALLSTVLFSVAPALLGSRVDLRAALHAGSGRQTGGLAPVRARKVLVVVEVALAVLLVVGAGLFVRSLAGLYAVDPGFDVGDARAGVLTVRVSVPGVRYEEEAQVEALFDEIVARASALPGVLAVGQSRTLPLGGGTWTSDYSVVGLDGHGVETQHLEVDEGFAEALGLRLLAGRALRDDDRPGAEPVVLVSRELVRQIAPGAEPADLVGRRFCSSERCDDEGQTKIIVGVVDDLRFDGLARPLRPMVYHSLPQRPQWTRELFVRAAGGPERLEALAAPLQDVVRRVDAGLPLMKVRTLRRVVDESLARERFLTALLAGFGGLALLLALVGTYGVLATSVHQRRRELGIRAALGAGRGRLEAWVVRQGLGLVATGAALGLGLALVAARVLESQLYGVGARDPLTYAAAATLLVVTGLLAAWLPARSAARVDPVTVLRAD